MASRLGGSTLLRATDYLREKECPTCHKLFRPARESLFKIKKGRRLLHYCTWDCYRKGRKLEEAEGKTKRKKTEWRTMAEQTQDA